MFLFLFFICSQPFPFFLLLGAQPSAQYQGVPGHTAIYQPSNSGSPPTSITLPRMGIQQQPSQQQSAQQVTIQVQEPPDMSGAARGIPINTCANHIQMQQRVSLMASMGSYTHRPLSKQLSADSAEVHRYKTENIFIFVLCYLVWCWFTCYSPYVNFICVKDTCQPY